MSPDPPHADADREADAEDVIRRYGLENNLSVDPFSHGIVVESVPVSGRPGHVRFVACLQEALEARNAQLDE